jgi:hypothetical protein
VIFLYHNNIQQQSDYSNAIILTFFIFGLSRRKGFLVPIKSWSLNNEKEEQLSLNFSRLQISKKLDPVVNILYPNID